MGGELEWQSSVEGSYRHATSAYFSDIQGVFMSSSSNVVASPEQPTSFADLGKEMWSFLTGRGAAINYEFVDMTVEVPRDTGADTPRATWKLNGILRITTSENASGA